MMARCCIPVLLFALLFGVSDDRAIAERIHVSLECEADFYAAGDSAFFVWTNDTDSTAVAGNHPPYVIHRADTGELICQAGLPWEYHLEPHQWARLDWDQRDCDGNLVPPGPYLVRIYYVFNDAPPTFFVEDRFNIVATASTPEDDDPVLSTSWSRLRWRYR